MIRRIFYIIGFCCAASIVTTLPPPAGAEFRMSHQRPLSLPDPFLPKKNLHPIKPRAKVRKSPSHHVDFYAGVPPSKRLRQRKNLAPAVMILLHKIEHHFGKQAEITSACRSKAHNRRVGGAPRSYHLKCLAADIRIAGVSTEKLSAYAKKINGRGGVGTYCGLDIVHIDAGPKRQWHRPCNQQRNNGDYFDPLWLH